MKKVLFVLSLVAVMVSCSKSPVDEAVAVYENGADLFQKVAKNPSYDAYADALIATAKEAQAFIDTNKDYKPEGDDVNNIVEAAKKFNKAQKDVEAALEEKYKGKEDEAMTAFFSVMGKIAELEKSAPDFEKFLSLVDVNE